MKKMLFAFLLMIVVFLTACTPTNNDDEDPIDDGKDDDNIELPENPLEGIDEALILAFGDGLSVDYEGEDLVYYFYLEEEITITFSLEASFDSEVVIENITTNQTVFEGDDSIYGDDVFVSLTLGAGEYQVTISSNDDMVGDVVITLEEGNSFDVLVLGEEKSISLDEDEIVGLYLTIEEAGTYLIKSDSMLDLEGVLTTLGGEFLTYNDDLRFDETDFALYVDLEVGQYIVGVRAFDESVSGSFDIIAEPYEEEVGNDLLLVGTYQQGILIAGRRNSYTITVPSDGYVSIYNDSAFDSYGRLYDGDELLAEDDDANGDQDFYLYAFLEAGTYTLEVSAYDDYECGYYELFYSFTEGAVGDFDEITLNTYVIDSMRENEIDIFELVITEGVTVDIYSVSGYDLYAEIYTINNVLVEYNDDGGSGSNFLFDDLYLEAGTYYIYVEEYFSSPVDYYELHVYTVEGATPPEAPVEMYFNSSVTGTLPEGGSHVYSVSIPTDGLLTVYLVSHFDSVGYITDIDGNMLISNDDASFDNDDFKIEDFAVSAGIYNIHVEGYSSAQYGEYTLFVIYDEIITEQYYISPNSMASDYLNSETTDTYQFTLDRAGYVYAYLDSNFDSVGSLNEYGGDILLTSDDYGTDTDFYLQGIYLEPGIYEINISGFTLGEYGNYDLYLEVVYGSMNNASVITFPTDVENTLQDGGYDWYSFEVVNAGYLYTYADSGFDSFAYLIDEYGYMVTWDDDTYGNSDFEISWYIEPGTYYLVVCGYTVLDSGLYSLHLEFTVPID
ncbi:MAG: hypothetical protein ACVCEJ_07295 [Candidatus Izemoplasmataceae bacterium]